MAAISSGGQGNIDYLSQELADSERRQLAVADVS